MTRKAVPLRRPSLLLALAIALPTGCDALDRVSEQLFERDEAYLIGADGDRVFYEYVRSSDTDCNEWGFCDNPSSLWAFDVATGKSSRIQRPIVQCRPQAYGDYFVTERCLDDDSMRLEAVQISTGRRTTILERDPTERNAPLYLACEHILDGERVMVLRLGELFLFGLGTRSITWTFDLPADFNSLTAFGGDYVVASSRDPQYHLWYADLLIDVVASEVIDIASPPAGISLRENEDYESYDGVYEYAGLAAGWLAADGQGTDEQNYMLGFYLPTRTWHVVLGPASPAPAGAKPHLLGVAADGAFIITWHTLAPNGITERIVRVDRVDPATGHTDVACDDPAALAPLYAWFALDIRVHNNKVYWIDEFHMTGRVAILDLDTGRVQIHQLGGPFGD